MKYLIPIPIPIVLVLLLTGCNSQSVSFDKKFFALFTLDSNESGLHPIEKGKSRSDVLKKLGSPLQKREDTVPGVPIMGPQEGLDSLIEPGSPYEEWLYRKDGYDYYIWFSTTTGQPESQWVVMAIAKYETGSAF